MYNCIQRGARMCAEQLPMCHDCYCWKSGVKWFGARAHITYRVRRTRWPACGLFAHGRWRLVIQPSFHHVYVKVIFYLPSTFSDNNNYLRWSSEPINLFLSVWGSHSVRPYSFAVNSTTLHGFTLSLGNRGSLLMTSPGKSQSVLPVEYVCPLTPPPQPLSASLVLRKNNSHFRWMVNLNTFL